MPTLISICACAAGAMAKPTTNAVLPSSVLSPRINAPFKVLAITCVAWDAVCSRKDKSGNSSFHKGFKRFMNARNQVTGGIDLPLRF
jgi:hypothetical protein